MTGLRLRFLVAMGVAGCAKPPDANADANANANANADANALATASASTTPTDIASVVPSATASASADPVDAAPQPSKHAPTTWSVTYPIRGLGSWCATATAQCFPRAHVPSTWGHVQGHLGELTTNGPSRNGCLDAISVQRGCTPGGQCQDPDAPTRASLLASMSDAQSSIYIGGACCYALPQHCISPNAGRALTVAGERVVATRAFENEWHRIAVGEHASIASFARASLELMALGAPAELVADTHRAALDEIEHARIAFDRASQLAGHRIEPSPLAAAVLPIAAPTFESFARATFRDACLEETIGAVQMRARDARIADDEERHAELAWRTLAWAVRAGGGGPTRAVLRAEVEALSDREDPVVRDVVVPCARALLASV